MILSSSLHGLIISESYEIPNIWIKVSQNINGGYFKYNDYYESIGIQNSKPYIYTGNETKRRASQFNAFLQKGKIDLKPLINSAPFDLNEKIPIEKGFLKL